jgi:hypothetical protein
LQQDCLKEIMQQGINLRKLKSNIFYIFSEGLKKCIIEIRLIIALIKQEIETPYNKPAWRQSDKRELTHKE